MRIVCERGGSSITFAHARPYWLQSAEGLGEADYDVSSEKAAGMDGEIYKGATANKRNIVIKATVIPPEGVTHDQIREEFFALFVPRETGTLTFYDGERVRKIDYKTENCEFDLDGQFRDVTVSLICPDPVFKAAQDERVDIAETEGLIEWPIELEAQFEVGLKHDTLMGSILNPSSVSRGLTATFTATGEVVNPKLIEVNRQQSLRILVTLHAGDVLTVTTGAGNKRVKLLRDNEETNINNCWEFGGTWLQAEPGENLYTYEADSGLAALSVTLTSTPLYWGV